MNKIKFSEDYEKLPVDWVGTYATLIGVYPEKVKNLKARYSLFLEYDTKVRGEERHYPLNFEGALILVFIHHETGSLFPTIRRNYKRKFEYYTASIGETFVLTRI